MAHAATSPLRVIVGVPQHNVTPNIETGGNIHAARLPDNRHAKPARYAT